MKQIAKALTTSTLALGLATPLLAQVTLSVGAITDIYRAGGYNDGSDGGAPVAYAFTARPFQTLTFSSVTGAWTCNNSVPEYGPDGTTGSCYHTGGQDIDDAAAPFSAYDLTDFAGAMVGVFLEDALPSAAPASLRFYVSDNSQGGIQTDFKALAPKIGQVFFIGDGLTGTGSGSTQVFAIPPTATRLYLGYADTCSQQPGPAAPGCYSDNAGSLTAIFQIEDHELNWVEPQEQVSPAGRCCMGMAYDPSMRSTLLFGGYTNPTFLNDTWTWTLRQGWSQLSPAASPSPREAPGMAYDGAAQNMVLFGGTTSDGTYLNDTWIWDGTAWTQQSPAVSPSVRQFATMTYDAATGTIVLFGGLASGSAPLGDTWTWDGLTKTWTQQFPASSPSPREPMMTYDNATGTVLLFGGFNGAASLYNDTWTWDGTTWIQQFPASVPAARQQGMVAYDAILGSVVLFGGSNGPGGEFSDTWAWNGTNWVELHPATAPAGRWVAGMAYDPPDRSLMLFAGFGTDTLDDTWLFTLVPVNGADEK